MGVRVVSLLVAGLLLVAGCGQGDPDYGGVSHYEGPRAATRAESYHGLQVQVPLDWSLAVLGCREPTTAYVARPAAAAHCAQPRPTPPTRESVWFDSPLPVGARTAAGLHVVTVERAGVRLSVATRSESAGAEILDTAQRVGVDANGCELHAEAPGIYPDDGIGEVLRFSVCVYPDEHRPLLWSAELSPEAGQRFVDAERAGRPLRGLPDRDGHRRAVVELVVTADQNFGTYPATIHYQVSLGSGVVLGGPGPRPVVLDPAIAKPWTVAGVERYAGR